MKCLVLKIFICMSVMIPNLHAEEKVSTFNTKNFRRSNKYTHNWIPLPPISGINLNDQSVTLKAENGIAEVIIFIASWCAQCQQLLGFFQDLEKKYDQPSVRFTYIFSHDLAQDARGFAAEYQIKNGIIASHQILKSFHNPELPTVYISDRNGWLLTRFLEITSNEIRDVDNIIDKITTY